jgi:hypothetical protein
LGAEEPPFVKATLVDFRNSLVAAGLDGALLAQTVAVVRKYGGFDTKRFKGLPLAIDSAPLGGVGRVEDTLNLLESALRVLVHAVAILLAMGSQRDLP